uniref:ZP domain-containing protein n=1 Tax=Steinernema glaseri TaxID=37863 RepID=A0A1I7Y0D3_9BILA
MPVEYVSSFQPQSVFSFRDSCAIRSHIITISCFRMSDPGCNFLGTSSSTLPSAMNGMNGRSIGPNMSQNMNGHGMNSRFQINGNGGHLNGQHSGQNGHHNAPSHVGQSRTLEDALFDDGE